MTGREDQIRSVSERAAAVLPNIQTEEATKHALILPLIQALGYDVFNPSEVFPEFTADVGTKKGEKVDYAIMVNGEPAILIECKCCNDLSLAKHGGQLFRYFATLNCRLAILTNGVSYQFFSDLERSNVMDDKPFMEFDIRNMDERQMASLVSLSKDHFDLDKVLDSASRLQTLRSIRELLVREMEEPSLVMVKHIVSQLRDGNVVKSVIEEYRPLIKQAWQGILADRINERLRRAMEPTALQERGVVNVDDASSEQEDGEGQSEDGIETTQDELLGYYAVKAMLMGHVDLGRVTIRDSKTYCAVLLDNNNRKPLCRMWFNRKKRYFGIFDENKNEEKYLIEGIDDIYRYADQIRASVRMYDGKGAGDDPRQANDEFQSATFTGGELGAMGEQSMT